MLFFSESIYWSKCESAKFLPKPPRKRPKVPSLSSSKTDISYVRYSGFEMSMREKSIPVFGVATNGSTTISESEKQK